MVQTNLILHALIPHVVQIFYRCRGLDLRGAGIRFSLIPTAFEVVDTLDLFLVLPFKGVRHDYNVDWVEACHLDGEDAVDSRQQRRWVILQINVYLTEVLE